MATKPSKEGTANQVAVDLVIKAQKKLKASGKYFDDKFVKRADRMANYYQVNHYFDEQTGKTPKADRDRVKVAYPYSNVCQIKAEIYSGLPEVIVKTEKRPPKDPQQQNAVDPLKGVRSLKQSIDYVKRKSNLSEQADRVVLDGVAVGIGCLQMVAQKTTKVPKFIRKIYREVIYDAANVTDIYESSWIACKVVRELDDIKNDESYTENRSRVNTAKLDENLYGTSEIEYGVLWEWYDKKNDVFMVFPDDQQFPLLTKKLTELLKIKVVSDDFKTDWPFSFFICEPEILSGNGMGNIYPIESNVRELDKTRTQMINHRKRFNRKYLVKEGVLDAQGINQLKNPEDGTIIKHKSSNPEMEIRPLQDAPMSADVYQVEASIERDIQVIGPLGPNSLVHGVGQQPDTLGQSQIVEQSSNTRLSGQQKALSAMFSRTYRLIAQYIQQYWVETDELLVSGDGSKEDDWLSFTPAEIQGEYAYDVVTESMKDNSVVYRKQANDALVTVTPLIPVARQEPSVAIMVRKYLETFDTFKKDIDSIIPLEWTEPKQPQPEAQKQDIPSISIKLSDYPIPVQIKGLQLAGIDATPDDFNQMAAPAAAGDGQADPMKELESLIGGGNHQAILDSLAKLPQNERETITGAIDGLHQGQAPALASQSPTPAEQVPVGATQ